MKGLLMNLHSLNTRMFSEEQSTNKSWACWNSSLEIDKRYFMIDQQIAQHFVHYSKCLYHPLLFFATQIIIPFLNSKISANHDKWLGF